MESRSRPIRTLLCVALLSVLCAAGSALAQDNFKDLRREVTQLEEKLAEAEKALSEISRKVDDNARAQSQAAANAPKDLPALKAEGLKLRGQATSAQETRDKARAALAAKQGDLRAAASKHCVDQLAAAGNLNVRLQEIVRALDTWKSTLGVLPVVPALRDTTGLDPEARRATLEGDRARLKEFDAWAAGEETRLGTEIDRADTLIAGEKLVKDADNGPLMVKQSKELKETLKERQKTVANHRKQAADLARKIR